MKSESKIKVLETIESIFEDIDRLFSLWISLRDQIGEFLEEEVLKSGNGISNKKLLRMIITAEYLDHLVSVHFQFLELLKERKLL